MAERSSWTVDDRYGMADTIALRASLRIGRIRVDVLSDGEDPDKDPQESFGRTPPAEWMKALGVTDPNARRLSNIGCFLIRGDGRTVLIDTGYNGNSPARPTAVGWGELELRLREVGVRPDEVDLVVHTHLHNDHYAGSVRDGKPAFPRARVLVPKGDLDHWVDAPEDRPGATRSRATSAALRAAGVLDAFAGEHAVTPSLTMIPTPGHTPGHSSALVTSEGQHLVITGDVVVHPVQFEHLDFVKNKDDRPVAIRSRTELAGLAADKNALVTGGHFPILTIGRVKRVAGGFRWEVAGHPPLYED